MPFLYVINGPEKGAKHLLNKEATTLGRKHSNDVVISDLMVSRVHARIVRQGTEFLIEDVGGTNPLKLNDRVVSTEFLREGDKILLGNTTFEYREHEASRPSAPKVEVREDAHNSTVKVSLQATQSELHQSFTRDIPTLQRDHRRLGDLFLLAKVVNNVADSGGLFDAVIRVIFDNISARRSFIGLWDPDLEELREVQVEDRELSGTNEAIQVSQNMLHRAIVKQESVLTADAVSDEQFEDAESIAKLKIRSTMIVPLIDGDEVLGIIYTDDRMRSNRFSEEDLKFLTSLGNLTAVALTNLRLRQQLVEENRHLKSILGDDDEIVGESREIQRVLNQINKVAVHDTTVLITGESGTGKEMIAKAIHKRSPRHEKPFVAVNCAAIPENLIESELFGYAPESGIANANIKGKPGKFELSNGGTLFLDEIGDMPLGTQVKILRALQERVIERLGATSGVSVNLRIVAATNKPLEDQIRDGEFREDLYFRLKVFEIHSPPLRKRTEDVPLIAKRFLEKKFGGRVTLAPKTAEILSRYSWPGNVRELLNVLEQAAILGDGRTIRPGDLSRDLRSPGASVSTPLVSLAQNEKRHISQVLQSTGGNKSQAARILDISRDTLHKKIKQYELE